MLQKIKNLGSRRSRRHLKSVQAMVVQETGRHREGATLEVEEGDTLLLLGEAEEEGLSIAWFGGRVGSFSARRLARSESAQLLDLSSCEAWQHLLEKVLLPKEMCVLRLVAWGCSSDAQGAVVRGLVESFRLPELDVLALVECMVQRELAECSEPALIFRQDSLQSRFLTELTKQLGGSYMDAVSSAVRARLVGDFPAFRVKPVVPTAAKQAETQGLPDPTGFKPAVSATSPVRKRSMIDWLDSIGDTETETETGAELLERNEWNARVCAAVWETALGILQAISDLRTKLPRTLLLVGVTMTRMVREKFPQLTERELIGSFLVLRFVAPTLSTLPGLDPGQTAHLRNAIKVVQSAINATGFRSEDLLPLNVHIPGGTRMMDEFTGSFEALGETEECAAIDTYPIRFDVDLNPEIMSEFWSTIIGDLRHVAHSCGEDEERLAGFQRLVSALWGCDFRHHKFFRSRSSGSFRRWRGSPRSPKGEPTSPRGGSLSPKGEMAPSSAPTKAQALLLSPRGAPLK